MILSLEKKFVILNPPKTGTGFRERLIRRRSDLCWLGRYQPQGSWITDKMKKLVESKEIDLLEIGYRHLKLDEVHIFFDLLGLNLNDFFVCVFVRNPWDRMISWYNMTYNQKLKQAKTEAEKLEVSKRLLSPNVIERFINRDCLNNYIMVDNKVKVDYIGKLETHEKDMDFICNRVKMSLKKKEWESKYNSHHKSISKHFNSKIINKISNTESFVINQMGYKIEDSIYL